MKKLHSRATWLFFINYFLRFLVVFIVLFGYAFIPNYYLSSAQLNPKYKFAFIAGAIGLLALLFLWAWLTKHFYRYELSKNGFKSEQGVLSKKYVTIPYDRIQNVDIHRGILSRIIGLSDIQIQTAGTAGVSVGWARGGSEGRLPGIGKDEAEKLRDELIERAKKSSKDQGL